LDEFLRQAMSDTRTFSRRIVAWHDPTVGRFGKTFRISPRQAQMIGVAEIATIEAKVVLDEVLGLQRPLYKLRNTCRSVRMNALVASIDLYTKMTAQEKVPELVEAPISKGDWARVDFDLWKNVGHVVISDEARMKAVHDVMGISTRDCAGALEASANSQIGTELETATGVAGQDWGDNTKNPIADIAGIMVTLGTNGFSLDRIAAHPLVWADYFGNTYIKGSLQGVQFPDLARMGTFPVPGLPSITGISDFALTNTKATCFDSAAAYMLGEGPTVAASYRNEPAGYDAYIMRQWLEPKKVVSDAARVLTGVHA
jgi:hypothetical protein